MKKNKSNIIILIIFLTGALIMTYPFYSNALNTLYDKYKVSRYLYKHTKNYEKILKEAEEKNQKVSKDGLIITNDPFEKNNFVNVDSEYYQEHLIGSVEIPKLNISIPLFDTTNNSLLDVGATVLDGSSLPVGKENNHSIITAHRGLPNRELFTNIVKLEIDEIFIIEAYNQMIAYKIVEIETVLPYETESLKIEDGKDLITLVTCTPYMLNTHRYLVKGERVELTSEITIQVKNSNKMLYIKQLFILTLVLLLVVIVLRKIIRIAL